MENKRKAMVKTGSFLLCALLAGLLGTFVLYRWFPQYLCYTVQDVHAGELYERREATLSQGLDYTEYFVPAEGYLKSILVNLTGETSADRTLVRGTLSAEDGSVIARSSFRIGDVAGSAYGEFPIEKWVPVGQTCRFTVSFPENTKVSVTFGPEGIGPEEHVSCEWAGKDDGSVMYMRYSYGSYSRKLLAFWFLVFAVSAGLLADGFWRGRKLRREKQQS